MMNFQGGYLVPNISGSKAAGGPVDWSCVVCSKIQQHNFVDAVTQVAKFYKMVKFSIV